MIATRSFNRESWARIYARKHLKTDPGIRQVFYLPTDAPEREIRLIEVNELIAVRDDDVSEAIDFGVDQDSPNAHTLKILDVTPAQWDKIIRNKLSLPDGWSLIGTTQYGRNGK
ncbi:MAG: hypothetical protein ACKV2Q_26025 [Planctomycetaceae bacterium]